MTKKANKKVIKMTKPKKAKVAVKVAAFDYNEIERRGVALAAASQLVSNPVHAFAATPQNVMALANTFFHWMQGTDAPVQEHAVTDSQTAPAPTTAPSPQTYA